jgi:hypothetical protein
MQSIAQARAMSNLLGAFLMFTCHSCKQAGITMDHQFDTWSDLCEHRNKFHTSDFVDGVPFWMLEVRLYEHDYYWIARQIKDRRWLRERGGMKRV